MKPVIIALVLTAALVGFLLFIKNDGSTPPPPPRQTAIAGTPTPRPTFTPYPTPTPRPSPTPYIAPPPQAAPGAPATSADPRMNGIAQQEGVQIVSYNRSGATGIIEVSWATDNATQGTDFAEALRRQGLVRRWDVEPPPLRQAVVGGRRVFSARYKLFF